MSTGRRPQRVTRLALAQESPEQSICRLAAGARAVLMLLAHNVLILRFQFVLIISWSLHRHLQFLCILVSVVWLRVADMAAFSFDARFEDAWM